MAYNSVFQGLLTTHTTHAQWDITVMKPAIRPSAPRVSYVRRWEPHHGTTAHYVHPDIIAPTTRLILLEYHAGWPPIEYLS